MGWFVNKYSRHGQEDIQSKGTDLFFQSTSVTLTVCDKNYDTCDIFTLWSSGVNIFNVDRTVHDEEFYNKVKLTIAEASRLYEPCFYRPIGLAVTMSVVNPCEIDERVDILILKEVTNKDDLTNFKKKYIHSPMPILLFVSTQQLEDVRDFIKFTDGLVLDLHTDYNFSTLFGLNRTLKLCQETNRIILYSNADMIKEYSGNVRQVLNISSHMVKHHLDGVVYTDTNENEIATHFFIRSHVASMRFIESYVDPTQDYFEVSLKTYIPVTVFTTVSLAACSAALYCGASAIVLLTATGRSAKYVACAAPPCHVLAITTRECTARRLHMFRKVLPLLYDQPRAANWHEERWNRIRFGTTFALKTALFCHGAKLVVLSPTEEGIGYCDAFHIVTVPFKCDD